MDRLLQALANRTQLEVLDCLLDCDAPMSALELRTALGIASKDRAHFGRQLAHLHDAGVLERAADDGERYVVAEHELVEQFLLAAADLAAALDARRAARSKQHAATRRKRTITRRMREALPAAEA